MESELIDEMKLDTPQATIRILTFNLGHGADMSVAAAAIERAESEDDSELVTAYASPSATGDRVVHYFVLRRRPSMVAIDDAPVAQAETKVEVKPNNALAAAVQAASAKARKR
jgi:hypothetical protein